MLKRPLAFCPAPRCQKLTPRLESGACATCRSRDRDRRAKRQAKAVASSNDSGAVREFIEGFD